MKKVEKTKLISNLEELELIRKNFIEKLELSQKQISEAYKTICTYPNSIKSFEISSHILNIEQEIAQEYHNVIKKGALLTSQSSICKIISLYEEYSKRVDCDEKQSQLTINKKILEQLYGKDKRNMINYDQFVLECRQKIFDHLNTLKEDQETLNIMKHNISQYFTFYTNCLHKYSYNLYSEDTDEIITSRFVYFKTNDQLDVFRNKAYKNMYLLFKDYYNNFEMRKCKLTIPEKEKYEQETEIISSIPIVKIEYEKYKNMCKYGKKDETSELKDFMEEFNKPKIKVIK